MLVTFAASRFWMCRWPHYPKMRCKSLIFWSLLEVILKNPSVEVYCVSHCCSCVRKGVWFGISSTGLCVLCSIVCFRDELGHPPNSPLSKLQSCTLVSPIICGPGHLLPQRTYRQRGRMLVTSMSLRFFYDIYEVLRICFRETKHPEASMGCISHNLFYWKGANILCTKNDHQQPISSTKITPILNLPTFANAYET